MHVSLLMTLKRSLASGAMHLLLHIIQLASWLCEAAGCYTFAEDAAREALKLLHTRLHAPQRSFQDRACLLGPVFQVAMTLIQVAKCPRTPLALR